MLRQKPRALDNEAVPGSAGKPGDCWDAACLPFAAMELVSIAKLKKGVGRRDGNDSWHHFIFIKSSFYECCSSFREMTK